MGVSGTHKPAFSKKERGKDRYNDMDEPPTLTSRCKPWDVFLHSKERKVHKGNSTVQQDNINHRLAPECGVGWKLFVVITDRACCLGRPLSGTMADVPAMG
eukprot:100937-Pelagomonas_calceolata.AAC.2